ncbi:hypothetical protein D3C71_1542120 [compost metagenome]
MPATDVQKILIRAAIPAYINCRTDKVRGKGNRVTGRLRGDVCLRDVPKKVTGQGEYRVTAGREQFHIVGQLTNQVKDKSASLRSKRRHGSQQIRVLDLNVHWLPIDHGANDVILVQFGLLHRLVEVVRESAQKLFQTVIVHISQQRLGNVLRLLRLLHDLCPVLESLRCLLDVTNVLLHDSVTLGGLDIGIHIFYGRLYRADNLPLRPAFLISLDRIGLIAESLLLSPEAFPCLL